MLLLSIPKLHTTIDKIAELLEKGANYRKSGRSGDDPLCYAVQKRESAECIEIMY